MERNKNHLDPVEQIYQTPWPAGITEISKQEFLKYKDQLGKILQVQVFDIQSDPVTLVSGERATLHLDGFALGYMGEGPHGFKWLLDQVGAKYKDIDIFGLQIKDQRTFEL